EAVEESVARAPLTALVADPAYGERLRALAGGGAIQVVWTGDHAAVEALDADTPVLATLAAREQVSRRLRLLVHANLHPVSGRS
ncbi:MAG TPA: hypothetical protein VF541_12255, partial [Longimicrobium sp.]